MINVCCDPRSLQMSSALCRALTPTRNKHKHLKPVIESYNQSVVVASRNVRNQSKSTGSVEGLITFTELLRQCTNIMVSLLSDLHLLYNLIHNAMDWLFVKFSNVLPTRRNVHSSKRNVRSTIIYIDTLINYIFFVTLFKHS